MIGLAALGLWAAAALPAPAAWNNVFQPTLFHRRPAQVTQYFAPPAVVYSSPVVVAASAPVVAASPCDPCPCPQTSCSTSFTQRCFYQPVTTMQTQTFFEPVTTYKTNYFWEQVTSFRMSCFFDPCTCSYQQVATPVCSYQLRSQCCPVQSWVQRCCQVPVTTYQKACYWEPRTTCCTTTTGAPIPAVPQPVVPQPVVPQPAPVVPQPAPVITPGAAPSISQPTPSGYPPSVIDQKSFGAPTDNPLYKQLYPSGNPSAPVMPPASLKQPLPAPPAPPAKLEGIVMGPDSRLEGQVVHLDRSPRANAKVMFVSAQGGPRYFATANSAGRFSITLPAGTWQVYLYGADDIPVLNAQLNVAGSKAGTFTLVSR
jgi:hypothetical protein